MLAYYFRVAVVAILPLAATAAQAQTQTEVSGTLTYEMDTGKVGARVQGGVSQTHSSSTQSTTNSVNVSTDFKKVEGTMKSTNTKK